MDLKDIKSLIQFISKLDLPEVNIEVEGVKVHIKNNYSSTYVSPSLGEGLPKSSFADNLLPPPSSVISPPLVEKKEVEKNYISIKSPMIGTFYGKPSPEKETFVKVGDRIEIGTKLCIIEAMKLFNEIESEVSGKIVKMLVEDSTPVEYDQPLFLVDPT